MNYPASITFPVLDDLTSFYEEPYWFSIQLLIKAQDSGSGIESLIWGDRDLTQFETGSGVDALLNRALALFESGAGVESLLDRAIVIAETGIGIELATLFIRAISRKYIVELRDSSGNLVNILQNAYRIAYAETVNAPATLDFAIPADDSKTAGLTRANEIWLRNYDTGTVVKKFRLNLRRDIRA